MSAGNFVPFDNEATGASGLAQAADDLISRALDLMARSKALKLVWSSNPDGTDGSIKAVRHDLDSVRSKELRMAVVAPMKAGKSTFVNAMVGFEFLPARGSAMTTLPTRIVLDHLATPAEMSAPGGLQPEFSIEDTDARQLERLIEAIARLLEPKAKLKEVNRRFPHLKPLVDRILQGELTRVERTVTGREAVQQALMDLNDVLRLGEVLGLGHFARLSDIPVVHTPYWSPNAAAVSGPGRLVIIDTPGPDEATLAAALGPVVRQQLLQSHIVFAVIDYTHMSNQADEKIRQLMKPTLDVIGTEKLYAIVNKIDQRDSGLGTELTDEQLVEAVGSLLGIPEDLAPDRVFGISAEYALRAVAVLGEIAGNRPGDVGRSETVRRLLWLTEGRRNCERVQRELASDGEQGPQRLAELARQTWERDGLLDGFLDSAVADLRVRALPEVIATGLGKTVKEVGDVIDSVQARRDLIGRKSGDLAQAAQDIADDIKRVGRFQSTVATADKVADRTVIAVGKILDRARGESEDVVADMELALPGGTQRFDSSNEARLSIQATLAGPSARIDGLLTAATEAAEAEIGRAAKQYVAAEAEKVQPIIDRAAASLKDAFNISFTVPDYTLTLSDSDVEAAPEQHTESWTSYETRTRYERRWYTLGLKKHAVTETVSVPRSSSYYTVSSAELVDKLRNSLHSRVEEIHNELSGQIRNELATRMDDYYAEVERFLDRYKQFLEQSAQDNQLEKQEQQDLRNRLDDYQTDAEGLQQELRDQHQLATDQLRQRNGQ